MRHLILMLSIFTLLMCASKAEMPIEVEVLGVEAQMTGKSAKNILDDYGDQAKELIKSALNGTQGYDITGSVVTQVRSIEAELAYFETNYYNNKEN